MKRLGLHYLRRSAVSLAGISYLLFLVPVSAAARESGDLDQILQELEAYAQQLQSEQRVPGMAYAVVEGSDTVYTRGFGFRDRDASSGMVDEATLFEIGSTTKAFNAAVLGTLVDEGKVAWGDKVRDHFPDFKMYDSWVTKEFLVADLLAQRPGIPPYSLDMMSLVGFSRRDIMRATRYVEPVSSFRSQFSYQNNLHLWAAELIERKTGMAWEEVVRQRVLEPLGMSESTFDFATNDANPNHAMGHVPQSDGSLWTIPSNWPYRGWLLTYAPAGGLNSNVRDMARWVALQIGEGTFGGKVFLKPETVQTIRAPRIFMASTATGTASYATAWVFQSSSTTPFYWHNGETVGMHSIVAVYPEGDLGLVVLTNTSGNTVPECMVLKLLELYFGNVPLPCATHGMEDIAPGRRSLPGPIVEPDNNESAIPLNKLVGTYSNPAYGKIIIEKAGSGITLTIGLTPRSGPLSPIGTNQFRFDWPDWPGQHSTVVFRAGPSGNVTKLRVLELFDVQGGDFRRIAY
ncbi:MAG: serine hydrolase [Acidobacteriota bacterium]